MHGERGFSLIETVIALGIFATIGIAFLSAVTTSTKATGQLDDGVQAEALARSHLEAIKECGYADEYTTASCSPMDDIVIPFQFTVTVNTDCSSDGGFNWAGTCSGESFQRITVAISREGRPVLSLTTYKRA